jgi:hypothetical protein
VKRRLDNLTFTTNPRTAEWTVLLDSWLRAEEDEEEARKWEGWVLDEVNRQRLPLDNKQNLKEVTEQWD